ncbi:MAG: alpha/beta hydrolase [Tetrasphaera jenkinsii]|jgi:acetyl esterase/lipase|uniref:BD-FAE-like domain-containing protein n=1 Tax=Nostocoides jenkinsii Ben 74 TaxID=1193518 RepID=A0A077MC96_9MICO|nr:alpha/beta hydrolase [Tetrasphaera jenkinsii]MCI1261358.1 alpha/beta hydrolase [Tetrasphaera jenkinsii]CCI52328.1 conserved hypothetical protein [Tetrasphaera jenkinsii Ben 74]
MSQISNPAKVTKLTYGRDPSQFAELHLPDGGGQEGTGPDARETAPVCVVVHGGFWRARYGLDLGTPLARDLAAHGVAALNVEYRRVGNGGGWPNTCADVAAAVDALAAVADRVDLTRVVALGHSAGGHLAGWLAGRARLRDGAPGANPVVPLSGFVSQAGVLDLELAVTDHLGAGAVAAFLDPSGGGEPAAYEVVSPVRLLPTGVPSVLVHGTADEDVPLSQSESYAAAAARADDSCRLVTLPGADHFGVITPDSPDWHVCRAAVLDLVSTQR